MLRSQGYSDVEASSKYSAVARRTIAECSLLDIEDREQRM